MLFQRVPSPRELFALPTPTLGHFSTFPGLRPLSLRSMCVASTYKEALGDGISRIRRDSHMSSSSNWYSKLYTSKCHQEREKELGARFAFQHLPAGDRALCPGGGHRGDTNTPAPPVPHPSATNPCPSVSQSRREDRSMVASLLPESCPSANFWQDLPGLGRQIMVLSERLVMVSLVCPWKTRKHHGVYNVKAQDSLKSAFAHIRLNPSHVSELFIRVRQGLKIKQMC